MDRSRPAGRGLTSPRFIEQDPPPKFETAEEARAWQREIEERRRANRTTAGDSST